MEWTGGVVNWWSNSEAESKLREISSKWKKQQAVDRAKTDAKKAQQDTTDFTTVPLPSIHILLSGVPQTHNGKVWDV